MFPQAMIHLVSQSPDNEQTILPKMNTRLNTKTLRQSCLKTVRGSETDPFLLILLADQELIQGRDEQARYLIEAAYHLFDQNASTRIFKLHLAS